MKLLNRDIVGGLISLGLGLALILWLIPVWVETDDDLRLPVGLLPQIVAIGLIACGGLLAVRSILATRRDTSLGRSGFDPDETGKFLFMIGVLLAATIGFQFFHFLIVAPVLVAISMWMFSPVRPVSLVLTSALGPLVIWFLGTEILGRVLP